MLNLNDLFLDFNDNLTLKKKYKDLVTTGRNALRNKIGSKFEENDRKKPKYYMQGSYAMNTAINPEEDEEFDLDDGVYLQGYSDDKDTWPATTTVHDWVKKAVDKHTSNDPIDKNTCVRVVYEEKYHIDLPIYIMGEDEADNVCAYLAHKSKGWIESDPKAFKEWFQNCVNENGQVIRHMVKFLKAWKVKKGVDIPGMAITILICNNYTVTDKREDISLLDTVTNILDCLDTKFECYKPVTPTDEDLFAGYSETKKENVIKSFKTLKSRLNKAIYEEKNEKKATDLLQKEFGDRFPEGEDKDKSIYDRTFAPIQLGGEDSHFA